MASWHNNFSYPPNLEENRGPNPQRQPQSYPTCTPFFTDRSEPGGSLPAVPHVNYPPPSVGIPPTMVPPPFLPNIPPPIYNTMVPPPTCNTMVPPPVCSTVLPSSSTSFPPPILNIPSVQVSQNVETDEDEKFERLKTYLEGRYQNIKQDHGSPSQLKVSEIKEKLVKCFGYLEQLESLMNCLQLTSKSLAEEEWLNHCKSADELKEELSLLINELKDHDFLNEMKKIVQKRKKKRDYRKRKQKEWQEQKRVAKLHSEQENRRIDLWLEKMKDQVARAKREEDIKREADMVLSDVTAKKAEAKRMLNMLNSLTKLRAARVQNLPNEKLVSENENKAFTEIIERLKKMWLDQFNDYKVEEEGLKVMLEHAEEERSSLEAAKLRKNLKAWSHCIFGASVTQPLTIEELINARRDWDKFICNTDAPMASSIPVGWVLPCEPSSKEWAKLL